MNLFAKALGMEFPEDRPALISFADFNSYEEWLQSIEDEMRMKESEKFNKEYNND